MSVMEIVLSLGLFGIIVGVCGAISVGSGKAISSRSIANSSPVEQVRRVSSFVINQLMVFCVGAYSRASRSARVARVRSDWNFPPTTVQQEVVINRKTT